MTVFTCDIPLFLSLMLLCVPPSLLLEQSRKFYPTSHKLQTVVSQCEISSSQGGEYDVQSCLLGYTAV
jgi:hypothetical protein